MTVFGELRVPPALQNLHHRLLDHAIQHRRDAQLTHPAVRLGYLYPSHRLRFVSPCKKLFADGCPVLLQVSRQRLDRHAVDARTSLVGLHSLESLHTVVVRADLLHQLLLHSQTFGHALRRERFGPSARNHWSFTPPLLAEGQPKLGFLPLPSVWAFAARATTMPAADSCRTIRVDRSTLSPDSGTCSRPPAIRMTAFNAQPPNLQPAPLMDMDFAVIDQLVRHRMPHIRFLSIGSRLCSTLPSDPASRRRPCASLSLLLHQDVKRTYTSKMSFMHGVPMVGGPMTRSLPPPRPIYPKSRQPVCPG